MRIESSNLQMQSTHLAYQRTETFERMEAWRGERGRSNGRAAEVAPVMQRETVNISDAGRSAQQASAIDEAGEAAGRDPRLQLLIRMVEFFTGRPVKFLDANALQAPADNVATPAQAAPGAQGAPQPSAGFGIDYEFSSTRMEYEAVSFAAEGKVRTADGREIDFSVSFSMERSYAESINVRFTAGDAAQPKVKDPLVLDFGGPAAALSDMRFSFDLDADGSKDDVPGLAGGTGFLAFDRNDNGRIDDGRELFGPTTGQGFAELALLDADGNGWIDEADPAFAQLRVWQPDASGAGTLMTLLEADVGALSVANVATPFDVRNGNNETLGLMRASSVYLRESGGAGSVSQIDLAV